MSMMSESKTITRDPDWSGPAVSPGEMLLEEFLKPLGLQQVEAAKRLGISANRLNEVILGKRRVTPDTALRLSRFLSTSAQFWMRLQADWDVYQATIRLRSAGGQILPTKRREPTPMASALDFLSRRKVDD